MSVTRINEFEAKEGQGDALHRLVASFVPMIEASEGCHRCRLLRGLDEPEKVVVVEDWDDVEAHRASIKNIPPDALKDAMALLARPPKGAYFQ